MLMEIGKCVILRRCILSDKNGEIAVTITNKIILSILCAIGMVSSLRGAAIPRVKVPSQQNVIHRLAVENAEQKLKELAHSLDLVMTKKMASDTGRIDIYLADKHGEKYAYLVGNIDFLGSAGSISLLEVVWPGFRGKGIARLLIEVFYAMCLEWGCKKITWIAQSFGNYPISHATLINFYQKLGARVISVCKGWTFMQMDVIPSTSKQLEQYAIMQQRRELILVARKDSLAHRLEKYRHLVALSLLLDVPVRPFVTSRL